MKPFQNGFLGAPCPGYDGEVGIMAKGKARWT